MLTSEDLIRAAYRSPDCLFSREGYIITHQATPVQDYPAKEEPKLMTTDAKDIDARLMNLDDLIGLHFYLRSTIAEYDEVGADVPEWLTAKLRNIRLEIRYKVETAIESRLTLARKELDLLKTDTEKRRDIQAEIGRLEKKLSLGQSG